MGRFLSKTGNLKTRKVKKKKDLAMGRQEEKKRERKGRREKERGEMDFKSRKNNWGKYLQSKTDTHW